MMKVFLWLLASTATSSATASATAATERRRSHTANDKKSSQNNLRTLLQDARRIDENANGKDFDVEDYLENYSLKMKTCHHDQAVTNSKNGYSEYGVVIFRLCPSNSCDSGCKSNYAEFAVGINTFVSYYTANQANVNGGDNNAYEMSLSECGQYNDNYVGPACTSDGTGIRMATFDDQYCSVLSSGKNVNDDLPFASGGMVSSSCVTCANNGEMSGMCGGLYGYAEHVCENWDIQHYYYNSMTEVNKFGVDTSGCLYIANMNRKPEVISEWFSIFLLTLLVIGSLAGGYWYAAWWKQKKMTLEKIDSEDSGDSGYQKHTGGDDNLEEYAKNFDDKDGESHKSGGEASAADRAVDKIAAMLPKWTTLDG